MLRSEEELVETALLRSAQQEATRWGADRFAAEFRRRDLEERWLQAARSHVSPHAAAAGDGSRGDLSAAPVDAAAAEQVVGSDPGQLTLMRPRYTRHPSVPRPPVSEAEPERRRARRRRRDRSGSDPAWMISPAERARMTASARRLYGLDDHPVRRR